MSRWFEKNGTLKIISVIFAVILWMYAVDELNPETTRLVNQVPVEVINESQLAQQQMILVEDPQRTVNLRLRGRSNVIRQINPANIRATLDLGAIDRTGRQQAKLSISGVDGLGRDIRLVTSPEIEINVNAVIRKEVPLVIAFVDGEDLEAYQVHEPVIQPETILVTGAESLVRLIVQGVVEINLRNSYSISQSFPIRLVDDEGRTIESKFIQLEQAYALVRVDIYPRKSVQVEASLAGSPADGFEISEIEITPRNITVNGDAAVLENLRRLPTTLIDVQGARRDIITTVYLQELEGIYIDPSEPVQISVVVRIQETTIMREFVLDDISFLGLPEGWIISHEPQSFVVTIKGLYTRITPLTEDSLRLSVNVSDLEPDTYVLPVLAHLPDGVEAEGVPATLTVTLIAPEEVSE